MAHPCATDPELWFRYPDDDGSDGAAKARAYERSATQARINACAGARSYSSAGVLNTRSSIGWSTAYGPASSFPAASTESANSSRQPTTCCVGLPAARSIPGSSRTMRLCWPATKDSRSPRCPGSWCTCRSHRLAHNRPLDARSASPAVAKPSVIRLGSRVRRRSGSPDHLPSARICVSSRRSPRRLLWCYRRPLARCSESTIR